MTRTEIAQKFVGGAIIAGFFGWLIYLTASNIGWIPAIKMWGLSIGAAVIFAFGLNLLLK